MQSQILKRKELESEDAIISLAEELFKEKFKILSFEEQSKLEDKIFLSEYIKKIRLISHSFEKELIAFGVRANGIISEFELTDDLFYRKGQGIPSFVKSMVSGNIKGPNAMYVRL